jgi:hypothetical protein
MNFRDIQLKIDYDRSFYKELKPLFYFQNFLLYKDKYICLNLSLSFKFIQI